MESVPVKGKPSLFAKIRSAVDVLASVGMIVAASVLVWNSAIKPYLAERARNPLPKAPFVVRPSAAARGNVKARVVLIEFSDFQCPYCGQFARETLPEIERDYVSTGRVRLVFQHLPLKRIHPFAEGAARGAVCAQRAGKFWEFHDALFRDQKKIEREDLLAHADELGMERAEFSSCMDIFGAEEINRSYELARDLSISSTPTLLLGVVQPDGAVKITERLLSNDEGSVSKVIDRALAKIGA